MVCFCGTLFILYGVSLDVPDHNRKSHTVVMMIVMMIVMMMVAEGMMIIRMTKCS